MNQLRFNDTIFGAFDIFGIFYKYKKEAKPTTNTTKETKPTTVHTKEVKPTTSYTEADKPTTSYTKVAKPTTVFTNEDRENQSVNID